MSFIIKYCFSLFQPLSCPQSCPAFCDPMGYSPPGSSVYGISQAKILEQIAIFSSKGSSRPRPLTPIPWVSSLADRFFYHWATWETPVPPVLGSLTSYLSLSTFPVSLLFSFALLSLALVWGFVVVLTKKSRDKWVYVILSRLTSLSYGFKPLKNMKVKLLVKWYILKL